ncbi:hypothetical protein LRS10_19885 [Phenylobacterium sp. J426]|uniref:hypothetical protein n=1 Tax=Phenylobacterium sp. J426 TaxID=2898439 RepID=UPI002151C313|nr:hypothetical protein [Phenylobacterium sp. J426]MCR5876202.1 hypothetical protein [Phenylobacterium sp. J426]
MSYTISAQRGPIAFATHRASPAQTLACGRELAADGWRKVTIVGAAGVFTLQALAARVEATTPEAAT